MKKTDILLGVKGAMIDASYKSEKKRLQIYKNQVSCTPGCSYCCSRQVHITVAEALVIRLELLNNGILEQVLKRSEDLYSISVSTNPISWFKLNIKCPILNPKNNMCMAYLVRPAACSAHFSSSDPKLCDPWNMEDGEYIKISMEDTFYEFREKLKENVDGNGIFAYSLPIVQALLLADKIAKIKWTDWSQMAEFVLQELS